MPEKRFWRQLILERNSGSAAADPDDRCRHGEVVPAENDLCSLDRKRLGFDQGAIGRQISQLHGDGRPRELERGCHEHVRTPLAAILTSTALVHAPVLARQGKTSFNANMRANLILPTASLLLLLLLCGLVGGPSYTPDAEIVRLFFEVRQQEPVLSSAMVWLTQLGGSAFLVPLAAAAAAWLLWRREFRSAAWMGAAILLGRLGVELLKWATDRPRPSIDAHPVFVFSQAFPSGHAANSMITYLALALWTVPDRRRRTALIIAIAMSVIVGLSRPILGVHWPTDVLGGWSFGALWILVMFHASQFRRA